MDIVKRLADSTHQDLPEKKEKQVNNVGDLFDDSTTYFKRDIAPKMKTEEYLQSSVGWVYGCVNAIADETALINLKLMQQRGGEVNEIFDHPIIDLIYRANDFMTKFDLMWLTFQYLELAGEAPWYISYRGGRPDQIILLRPDQIEVRKGTEGRIIDGYYYKIGQSKIPLETYEVVFLRYPDPDSPFRGKGTLQALARTFDIDQYSEQYNEKFFVNAARPDLVLSTEQKLMDKQLQDLEKKLTRKFKGVDNSHKTLILQGGLKASPLTLTQRDMDFIEQQRFSRDKILAIFKVPKSILGITEDVNRANAEAGDVVFAKRTIKPKMERIIEQLNEFLIPLFPGSDNLYLDFENPVPEDTIQKLAVVASGLEKGWLTINEARAMNGLESIGEEGDKIRIQSSYIEVGKDIFGLNLDDETKAVRLKQLKARTAGKRKKEALELKLQKALKQEIIKQLKRKLLKKAKKKQLEVTEEEKEMLAYQEKQLMIGEQFIPLLKSKVTRIFNAQRKRVLGKMPAKGLSLKKVSPDKFMLDPEEEAKAAEKALRGLMLSIIIEESTEAYQFIGIENSLDRTNDLVTRYLKDRIYQFAEEMTKETNRLLGDTLAEGIKNGEGIPDLRKRVSGLFEDMEKYRSERIARSEVIRASNFASETVYKESGVVSRKRWLTALDDRTCEWCGPMNGKIIGLDDSFFDKGDSFKGRDGGVLDLDYEDVDYPPLHVNCRCTIIPIVQRSLESAKEIERLKQENNEKEKQLKNLDEQLNSIINDQLGESNN